MKTRILLLDTGKEWGGGTNSMFELLKRIDRERFEITACFYHDYRKGDSTLGREFAKLGIPLLVLRPRPQPRWAKLGKELARGLLVWQKDWRQRLVFAIELAWRIRPRAREIAAVLRQGGHALLYVNNQPASNLEGYLAAELANVPVVQHCRIDVKLNAFEVAATNRLVRSIVCVSHGVQASLVGQGVDRDKCVVASNGIDGGQTLPAPADTGFPAGSLVVGTVGQLVPRKAVGHLLQAVANLIRDIPNLHLLVVGDGPQQAELERLAGQLGIADRVLFAGFQKEALPWLAAMDIFVLASQKEGLPRVILEAMLLGKPVIASRVIGSRELVVDAETGYLYDYADLAALTARLRELCLSAPRRAVLGAAGRARVLANYSIERYVAEVSEVLAAASRIK